MSPIVQSTPQSTVSRGLPRARCAHGTGPARRAACPRYRPFHRGPSGWGLGDRRVGHGRHVGADSFSSQDQSVATPVKSQAPGYDYERVWYPAMPVRGRQVTRSKQTKRLAHSCLA